MNRFCFALLGLIGFALLAPVPLHAQAPDVVLTKEIDDQSNLVPGGRVIWFLTVRNESTIPLQNFAVHETVPLYTTFNATESGPGWVCSPGPSGGSPCDFDEGTLPAGDQRSYRFITDIDLALPSHVTELANCFTVSFDGAARGNGVEACAVAPIDPGPLGLDLQKSADPGSILEPGGAITWRLSYGNTGPAIADRAMLRETVPPRTTFSAAQSSPGWECPDGPAAGNVCVLRLGDLAPGSSGVRDFVTVIDPDLPVGTTRIENCVTLSWLGGPHKGFGPACAEVSIEVAPPGPPSFTITKEVDPKSTLVAGGRVIWLLSYTNTGTVALPTFQLHDVVPAHTTFDAIESAAFVCTPSLGAGSECVFHVGTLAPGQTGSARFITDIDAVLPPSLTQLVNCFTVTYGDTVRGEGQACATAPITPSQAGPLLTAWLDDELTGDSNGNGQANAGELITYSMTVTDVGNATAEEVVFHLDVDLNSDLQIGSVATSQGAVTLGNTEGDHSVQVELGGLGIHVEAVITWTVAVRKPLPPEVDHLSVQGELNGGNVSHVLTDDPATPQRLDPTVTTLYFDGSGVLGIPTLGELGLLALVLLLGAVGILCISKREGRAA